MNKKKLLDEISSHRIIASLSYISKNLYKIENYKLPKNPYTKENGYLKSIYNIIDNFKSSLNSKYPESEKFNNDVFINLFDFCEELFDEKYESNRNQDNFDEIVCVPIIKLFDELSHYSKKENYNKALENSVYLYYRLTHLNSKLRKINKNLLSSLILIYTVYHKKIHDLSKLTQNERKTFVINLDNFLEKIPKPYLPLKAQLINNSSKITLNNNLSAWHHFIKIFPDNTKMIQNMFNNVNYLYNGFLDKENGIFEQMKLTVNQNTIKAINSLCRIHSIINELIKIISKIKKTLKFFYMEVGKKL